MEDRQNNGQESIVQPLENIVEIDEGGMFTTSLIVARAFEKEHFNVLRDIEKLECSEEFRAINFEAAEYEDAQGKMRPAYRLTRDGFAFLAMGFTGKKAAAWKEKFLEAFSAMERALTGGREAPALHMEQKPVDVESFPFTPNCKLDKESGEILQGLARVVAWWRSESVDDIMRDLLVRLYCRRIEDVQRESFYSGLVFLWNKLFRIEKEGRTHVVHSLAEGKEALEGMISFWAYAGEAHTRSHITNYLCNKCNITGLSAIDDENTLRQAFLALFVGFTGRTLVDFREREMRFLY